MTYTRDEIIEEDVVETFEYCPRSFVEQLPPDPSQLSPTNKPSPKRGSFTELRNTILTKVSTPRGHRRSKSQIKRHRGDSNSVEGGEESTSPQTPTTKQKLKLGRALSLDLLGSNNKNRNKLTSNNNKHHKSMEDDLMKGFSRMIVDMALPELNKDTVTATNYLDQTNKQILPNEKLSDDTTVISDNLSIRSSKDRSMSCPSYPSDILASKNMEILKSGSYGNATSYYTRELKKNIVSKSCPVIIKVDLCTKEPSAKRTTTKPIKISSKGKRFEPKSVPLQRKHSKWNRSSEDITSKRRGSCLEVGADRDYTKSASASSLCSVKTTASNASSILSDMSSVFNSDHSLNNAQQLQQQPQHQHQRPFSYLDIFKRDNQEEFTTPVVNNTLPARKTDCNCNTIEQQHKQKHNSTFNLSSNTTSDGSEDIDLIDHYASRSGRGRSSSMVEIGSTEKATPSSKKPKNKHEQLKKTTSNIYGLASPALLKKIFKKKKNSLPNNNKKNKKNLPTQSPPSSNETNPGCDSPHHHRKCVQIESFV